MKTTTAIRAESLRDKMDDVDNYSDIESLAEDVIEANFLEMKEAYRQGLPVEGIIHNILDLSTLPSHDASGLMLPCRIESVNRFIAWMKE